MLITRPHVSTRKSYMQVFPSADTAAATCLLIGFKLFHQELAVP